MISFAAVVAGSTPTNATATSPQHSGRTAGLRLTMRLLMIGVPANGVKVVVTGFIDAIVSIVRQSTESFAHSPPPARAGIVRADGVDWADCAAGRPLRDRPGE